MLSDDSLWLARHVYICAVDHYIHTSASSDKMLMWRKWKRTSRCLFAICFLSTSHCASAASSPPFSAHSFSPSVPRVRNTTKSNRLIDSVRCYQKETAAFSKLGVLSAVKEWGWLIANCGGWEGNWAVGSITVCSLYRDCMKEDELHGECSTHSQEQILEERGHLED